MSEKRLAILCVDDEELILKSLIMQLREHYDSKYSYEMATSAEEAFEIINELVGDGISTILVISDWLMPGMKGDEFLTNVHKKYPETVKIMLTGHADPQSVKNAQDNGDLFSCIRKPWDKESLLRIVEQSIELKHQNAGGA